MNIEQVTKVLPYILRAKIAPWFWGHHAKGKTKVLTKLFQDKGWLVFNFRLNTQADVGDILGLQDFAIDSVTGQKSYTSFFKPEWLHNCIEFCLANPDKGAVVFFDEVNRAARLDLLGPIFQMSLDGRLHTYEFPPNLHTIYASNPNTKDYSVLNLKDKALLSRFWHCYFNPSVDEWFKYAKEQDFSPSVISFLKDNPNFLEKQDLNNFSISDFTEEDRRKWEMIDLLIKDGLPDELALETIAGFVGIEISAAFLEHRRNAERPIALNDILNHYNQIRANVQRCVEDERTDILNKASKEIIEFFQGNPDFTPEQGSNAVRFIDDMPNDIMFGIMHAIYNKRKFHDYCENNFNQLKNIVARIKEIRRTVDPDTVKDLIND